MTLDIRFLVQNEWQKSISTEPTKYIIMTIQNERELLTTIRYAVEGKDSAQKDFYEKIYPMFNHFVNSGAEQDIYKGWTFDVSFFKITHTECELYRSVMHSSLMEWKYISIGKDDCVYAIPNKGIIKIHLHSFLWNF